MGVGRKMAEAKNRPDYIRKKKGGTNILGQRQRKRERQMNKCGEGTSMMNSC